MIDGKTIELYKVIDKFIQLQESYFEETEERLLSRFMDKSHINR
jgi:hypothetical protein